MRKFILVTLLILLPACGFGPRPARKDTPVPSAANPIATTATLLPAEATATHSPKATRAGTPAVTLAAPSTAGSDLRGIYVDSNAFPISKTNAAALSQALGVPGVDGLVLVIGWDGIEPSMGRYDWATLDPWMSAAASAGKHVELSIRADYHTPAWLFQPAPGGAGAKPLAFSFTRRPEDTTCQQETIAAPWDPGFLAQWRAMLAEVSAHLSSTGTLNEITLLRLTGIDRDSDELHLPARSASATCTTDGVATWQRAGYRPSLLLKGWDGITDAFRQSFPGKTFSVAIIASAPPFPPIAEDGSLIAGSISGQNLPLLTLAAQKFPGHLVIQNLLPYIWGWKG